MRKAARIGLRIAAGLLIGLLILAGGAALWLANYDWNGSRSWIAKTVEARTGRKLVVEGPLTVQPFSLHPRLRAENVTFANVDWGEKEPMFSAGLIDLRVDLWHLLYGRVVITELVLEKGTALLQRDAQGRRNWILKPPGEEHKGRSPELLQLQIRDSRVRVKDDASNTDVTAQIQSQPNEKVWGMKVSATGRVRGVPFKLSGDSGGLLQIMDEHKPYPIRLSGTLGKSKASAEGTLTGVATLQDLDVDMTVSGDNMAPLGEVLKLSLPHTKPYQLAGRLERRGPEWRFIKTRGKVGSSDLAGTLQVDMNGDRPVMTGDLKSKVLDLADLGPTVGTRKQKGEGVLPDAPFNPKRWHSVDADVKIHAGTIKRPEQLPLENLATRIRMQDAVLTLDPLEFGTAGGKLAGIIKLDGRNETIRGSANIRVQALQLAKLFPTVKVTQASVGDLNGAIELAGTGNSVARLLGSSNGKIGVYMEGGEVSEFVMQLVAINLWGIAKTKLGGDRQIPIRCVVGDFGVKDGDMQTNALVFDTEIVNVSGSGDINLKTEQLNLTLIPEPKEGSIASLRSPLYLRGSFAHPKPSVDLKSIAARGAGAAAMALLNPLLMVIPLLDSGPGKDSNCGKLIAELQQSARSTSVGRSKAPAKSK